MAKENNTHSFYKEAKKSFYETGGFDKAKFWKIFKKITKWSFYLFLTITALWGCVNEFILSTGGGLSQGIEFYANKDEVLPNIYQAESTVAYQKPGDRYYTTPDGNQATIETSGLLALPISVFNPNYGNSDAAPEAQSDELIISAAEVTKADGTLNLPSFAYQVTKEDPLSLVELVLINNEDLLKTASYSGGNVVVNPLPLYTLPQGLVDFVDEYNVTNTTEYSKNWVGFYTLLGDNSNLIDSSGTSITMDPVDNPFFVFDDENNIYAVNGYAVPTDSGDLTAPWQVVYSTLPSTTDDQQEVQYLTNLIAFYTGTDINAYDSLESQAVGNQITLEDSNGDSVLNQSINQLVISSFQAANPDYVATITPSYHYEANFDFSSLGIEFGQEYFVVAPSKANQLIPSQESLQYMYNSRNPNWYNLDIPSDYDYMDVTTQNAGWGLFDQEGNLIQLYSSEMSALNSDNSVINPEGNYLYAQQRAIWTDSSLSDITYDNSIFGSTIYYSFQTMIEDYVAGNYFGVNSTNLTIGKSSYHLTYANEFIGIGKVREVTGSIAPQNQYGTAIAPTWIKSSDSGGVYLPDETHQQTALDQSIGSVGYNNVNSERVAFAGWGDWGKAWSIQYGPLYGAFLFPISQIALWIQGLMPIFIWGAWGVLIGIFTIVFLLRGLGTLMSLKTTSNQQKMQEIQIEVAKINAKYAKYGKNPQMKQRKQMEIMNLYRKNEVNPLGSFGTIFITMPIFISMWILISAIPQYKIAAIGAFSFNVSAFYGIFNIPSMFFFYLLIGIIVGVVQGISAKLPTWLAQKRKGVRELDEATKLAMKKSSKTQNIMIGVFVVIGLTVPVLLAFYWIASSLFTIFLELGRHEWKVYQANKPAINKEKKNKKA